METIDKIIIIFNKINKTEAQTLFIKDNNTLIHPNIKEYLFKNIYRITSCIFTFKDIPQFECNEEVSLIYKGKSISLKNIKECNDSVYINYDNKCHNLLNLLYLSISTKYIKIYDKNYFILENYSKPAYYENNLNLGDYIIYNLDNILNISIESLICLLLCCKKKNIYKSIISKFYEFIVYKSI